jgi:hypothetical protein
MLRIDWTDNTNEVRSLCVGPGYTISSCITTFFACSVFTKVLREDESDRGIRMGRILARWAGQIYYRNHRVLTTFHDE